MNLRAFFALFTVCAAFGAAPEPAPPTDLRLPGVRERLAALRPDDALAYFELAEEVASEFPDEGGRRRAQQLFVLAYELDRAAGDRQRRLGPSVHRALAALSDNPFERRWLRLLGDAQSDSASPVAQADPIAGALDAAEAIAAFRAADAPQVRRAMDRPGAAQALAAAERTIPALGPLVRRMAEVPACPTCRNRLILKPAIGPDVALQICPTCRGNPGPGLSPAEFLATVRTEDLLIEPRHRRWSAEALMGGAAPIGEEGARDLSRYFRVDPAQVYFHPVEQSDDPLAGTWSDRPAAPTPAR